MWRTSKGIGTNSQNWCLAKQPNNIAISDRLSGFPIRLRNSYLPSQKQTTGGKQIPETSVTSKQHTLPQATDHVNFSYSVRKFLLDLSQINNKTKGNSQNSRLPYHNLTISSVATTWIDQFVTTRVFHGRSNKQRTRNSENSVVPQPSSINQKQESQWDRVRKAGGPGGGPVPDYRSRRFIPSERRAGCPLFSVTYIDNPARSRHGGPSRVSPTCLVAQYLDGEARTHKGKPTALLGPGCGETGASASSLLSPILCRLFPSPSSLSLRLCVYACSTFTAPSAWPSSWLTRGFTIHLSPGPRAVSYSLFIVST